jgi:hypothetical protein
MRAKSDRDSKRLSNTPTITTDVPVDVSNNGINVMEIIEEIFINILAILIFHILAGIFLRNINDVVTIL